MSKIFFFILLAIAAISIFNDARKLKLSLYTSALIAVLSILFPHFVIPGFLLFRFLRPKFSSKPSASPPLAKSFCPKCGNDIKQATNTCPHCQNKLSL